MYSEKAFKLVREAGLKQKDKAEQYLAMSKRLSVPTTTFALMSIIYVGLTLSLGTQYMPGVWVFGVLLVIGAALQILFMTVSERAHRKFLASEEYLNEHQHDYKNIDNAPNKEI